MIASDDTPDVPVHQSTSANSGDENIQKDLFWGLYEDLRSHARHAETLRSNAGSYMLAVAAALIGVITLDDKLNACDLPPAVVVAVLGLLTALFSASYAELYFRNRDRAARVLKCLDDLFLQRKAPTLWELAYAEDEPTRYGWARRVTGSTHLLWIVLPALVCLVGLYLIYAGVASGLTCQ
jgi:hypothetical protein